MVLKGVADAPALLEEFSLYRFEEMTPESQSSSGVEETPQSKSIPLWTTNTAGGIKIHYSLPTSSKATIQVFDCSGRSVDVFETKGRAGENVLLWNNKETSSGIYFIRIVTPESKATCKTILLR